LNYLSALKHVSGVIGNSSSGIIEAPSLKTGTVNIGDRQKGRVRAESIIDCRPVSDEIDHALMTLFSDEFQGQLKGIVNPHDGQATSGMIASVLADASFSTTGKKEFFDLTALENPGRSG